MLKCWVYCVFALLGHKVIDIRLSGTPDGLHHAAAELSHTFRVGFALGSGINHEPATVT